MAEFRSERRGGFNDRSEGRSFGNRDGGRGFGGRGGFNGRRDGGRGFGGRDSGRFERRPVTMHSAICDKCKKSCTVPFKPSQDKPVYCSECFAQNAPAKSDSPRNNSNSGSNVASGMSVEQFKQINLKLDKILALLETLEIDDGEDSDEMIEELDELPEEDLEMDKKAKLVESEEDTDNDLDSDENFDKD